MAVLLSLLFQGCLNNNDSGNNSKISRYSGWYLGTAKKYFLYESYFNFEDSTFQAFHLEWNNYDSISSKNVIGVEYQFGKYLIINDTIEFTTQYSDNIYDETNLITRDEFIAFYNQNISIKNIIDTETTQKHVIRNNNIWLRYGEIDNATILTRSSQDSILARTKF